MSLSFGTDGVRGVANTELTPELALALGRATARVLGPTPSVVVGRDTRRSGPMLEAAFVAGLASEGVDALLLGVAPTPAVAWVSADAGIPGAVISASHNPFADNGIKLFTAGGRKLADEVEAAVEAVMAEVLQIGPSDPPTGAGVGSVLAIPDHVDAWLAAVAGSLEGRRLDGLRVVLDCANGAASALAAELFDEVGADVAVLEASPDGTNINDGCGAAHPRRLARAVVDERAHLGFAFDGDADRCIAVDAAGLVVDGDQQLALLGVDRLGRGALAHDTVVVTVMTNLGFRQAMAREGIAVVDTPVGDRYVLEAMEAGGFVLGGEQSGHVIQRDLATTGDGLLTGLAVADVVARTGRPLADLAAVMTRLPQVLVNVRLPVLGAALDGVIERAGPAVVAAESELGGSGRVLLRRSGTEPLVRVMVEAPTAQRAEAVAAGLAAAVEAAAT
jgi:phosphoglucosamine mutase